MVTQKHINLRDRTLSKIFHGPHNIFLCSPLVILSKGSLSIKCPNWLSRRFEKSKTC